MTITATPLLIKIPGRPVSGNHRTGFTKAGGVYTLPAARDYVARVRSIATARAVIIGYVMPDYVRSDIAIYNCNIDRDNAAKVLNDALQGIAYVDDKRILDGAIARYTTSFGGPFVQVTIMAVDGADYGFAPPRNRPRSARRTGPTLPPHVTRALEQATEDGP